MNYSARFVLVILLALTGLSARADEAAPCVFCDIIAGTRPAAVVYRDDTVFAFMSGGPRNPGHVLILPVQHAENLLDVPTDTLRAMAAFGQRVARAIKRTDLRAEGLEFRMNSGKAAGQAVFHAHLHIIPRFAGEPEKSAALGTVPLSELEAVAAKIRAALAP